MTCLLQQKRISSQLAKKIFFQKVRHAESQKCFSDEMDAQIVCIEKDYRPKHVCLQSCSSQPSKHLGYIRLQRLQCAKDSSKLQLCIASEKLVEKSAYCSVVLRPNSLFEYDVYGTTSLHS